MNQIKCLYEELDDETRAYLQEVRTRRGNRTPGIFVGGKNGWPVVAFTFGPVILLVALVQGFLSTKDAWAVALLQTAGVMLGGWMVLYAFRRWFASGRKFGGFYTYFDPTHVYQVNGEAVTVTDVSDFSSVEVRHNFSGGSYGGSRVTFDLDGKRLSVPVAGETKADLVEDYYRSLVKLEEHDDRKWRELSAADMGGVAKYLATEEELPYDPSDVRLEVTETPAEPKRDRRAAPALLRYLAILAVGGLVYFGFWKANDPVRDGRAFARAEEGGAPGLRGYLLDERNTRHRDEALAKLAKLYDTPAAKVEAGVKDPVAKQGLLAVLNSLRQAPQPVVSIDVREQDTPKDQALPASAREGQLRTDLADAIATHLGKDLVGFVTAPPNQPAHFELVYKFVPAGNDFRGPRYKVTWQLRLRADPSAAPVEPPPRTTDKEYSALELGTVANDLKTEVFTDVFGQPPPFIQPLQVGGGYF
jgi:hypothetical protein